MPKQHPAHMYRIGQALYALYRHVEDHGGELIIRHELDGIVTSPEGVADLLERMLKTTEVAGEFKYLSLRSDPKYFIIGEEDAEDRQGGQEG